MRRQLGKFETAATLTSGRAPFNVVVVVRLGGGLAPERLRRALDHLQRLHPLLGVRIVERDGRFRYEPERTPAVPLRALPRAGDETWREVAEEELNRPLEAERGPLLRCACLSGPKGAGADQPSEIVLTFHHAVLDGASASSLVRQLLELSAPTPAGGEGATPGPYPALPAVETLFPPSYRGLRGRLRLASFLARQVADEIAFRRHSRGARKARSAAATAPEPGKTRCRILPVGLSAEETSALVRATRRERVTLNAALAAAFLLAACRNLRAGEPCALRYMTFADLRPYLRPPVAEDGLGSYLAMVRYTAEVIADDDFWELARDVSGQVAAGFRRGDKLCSALLAESAIRHLLASGTERMATTAVSYSGPVALPEPAGVPPVRGLHAFVSNFDLGPEYTALARIFAGELRLDILYLESDMDLAFATTMADDILETLRTAAKRRPTP